MAHMNFSLEVNGWQEDFMVNQVKLRQIQGHHHYFDLHIALPEGFTIQYETLKSLLGEKVALKFTDDNGENNFSGFIQKVIPQWTGQRRSLRLLGHSPTIFMDTVKRFRSFSKQTPAQIVDEISKDYLNAVRFRWIKKTAGKTIGFCLQNRETDFTFLSRLARDHGYSLFYDGQNGYFGNLNEASDETIALTLYEDLLDAELSVGLAPLSVNVEGYNLEEGKTIRFNYRKSKLGHHPAHSMVAAKAVNFNCLPAFTPDMVTQSEQLEHWGDRLLGQKLDKVVVLNGKSIRPALKLGSCIKIEDANGLLSSGEYVIIDIEHCYGGNSAYTNSFLAVPKGYTLSVSPEIQTHYPTTSLIARVVDIDDPQQLGRIKVEFSGDENKNPSLWLPVLVPFSKNGGMFFLPEVEDQVVVHYECDTTEHFAYVMGAFFNGKSKAERWQKASLGKRGIATRKTAILIDDESGVIEINCQGMVINSGSGAMRICGDKGLTIDFPKVDINP